ncbi:MAG: Fe-S cluster assembly protein SufD [Bacteroidota bacterium]|nr:Fe-S cluster assembly protein SufD [Bacteroidota bacterium]
MNNPITTDRMVHLFEENRGEIIRNDSEAISGIRDRSLDHFRETGLPDTKLEEWKNTNLAESFAKGYEYHFNPVPVRDLQRTFHCVIPHLDTAVIGQMNGWYVSQDVPLIRLGNGIIMGSLAQAFRQYPGIIEKYYNKYSSEDKNGLTFLNTAFAQDGVFIYVPDNVKSSKPIQLINVIRSDENLFIQPRNLIVLGKNSGLTLVHCDDSFNHQPSFSNIVTEVFLDSHARMDHYKLQNINNNSTLVSSTYFHLEKETVLDSLFLTLNGGLLRNNTRVLLNGDNSHININGLYLMDRKQHVDNYIYIDHNARGCSSKELFKGILDENASGVFNGHVMVRRDAQKTDAYQSNRNILLTDTAKVNSKPFLEIYADDVKCSHGSTTGQLDPEAMFYLRQRAIGEDNARMLLMFAFADEVVEKISIPPLRNRIEDMVKRRLMGESLICDQCVLNCGSKEQPVEFRIDKEMI